MKRNHPGTFYRSNDHLPNMMTIRYLSLYDLQNCLASAPTKGSPLPKESKQMTKYLENFQSDMLNPRHGPVLRWREFAAKCGRWEHAPVFITFVGSCSLSRSRNSRSSGGGILLLGNCLPPLVERATLKNIKPLCLTLASVSDKDASQSGDILKYWKVPWRISVGGRGGDGQGEGEMEKTAALSWWIPKKSRLWQVLTTHRQIFVWPSAQWHRAIAK